MKNYEFDTTLFGKLEVPADEGIFEEYEITLEGKNLTLDLYVEEDFLNEENAVTVSGLLEHIPQMYRKGREVIAERKESNGRIQFFIQDQMENLETLTEIFDVETTAEITTEMFIEKLEPRLIRIGLNSKSMVDCAFDFSLPVEHSDELLVVSFDPQYEVDDISHES